YTGGGGITATWDAIGGTLTLSGTATVSAYQSALRSVTYANTSDNPSVAARSVRFVVNDGRVAGAPAARSLTVVAVDDAPVAGAESYSTDADAPLNVPATAGVLANDTDVDGADRPVPQPRRRRGPLRELARFRRIELERAAGGESHGRRRRHQRRRQGVPDSNGAGGQRGPALQRSGCRRRAGDESRRRSGPGPTRRARSECG